MQRYHINFWEGYQQEDLDSLRNYVLNLLADDDLSSRS